MSDNVVEQGATGRMRYWLSCFAHIHTHAHSLTVVDSSAMEIASSLFGASKPQKVAYFRALFLNSLPHL